MKVVINSCYGGFGFSHKAIMRHAELTGFFSSIHDMKRTDPILIQIVEEMGECVNSEYAKLKVVEVPDDIEFEINESGGLESIHEVHRSWK